MFDRLNKTTDLEKQGPDIANYIYSYLNDKDFIHYFTRLNKRLVCTSNIEKEISCRIAGYDITTISQDGWYAILHNGKLAEWNQKNLRFQLVKGSIENEKISQIISFRKIQNRENYSSYFFITNQGRVFAKGPNSFGQLGVSTYQYTTKDQDPWPLEETLKNITSIHLVDSTHEHKFFTFYTSENKCYGSGKSHYKTILNGEAKSLTRNDKLWIGNIIQIVTYNSQLSYLLTDLGELIYAFRQGDTTHTALDLTEEPKTEEEIESEKRKNDEIHYTLLSTAILVPGENLVRLYVFSLGLLVLTNQGNVFFIKWYEQTLEIISHLQGHHISRIICDKNHSSVHFITREGKVFAWGTIEVHSLFVRTQIRSNPFLGVGQTTTNVSHITPVSLSPALDNHVINNIYQLGIANFFITETGQAFGCGENSNGELGVGDNSPHYEPTLISGELAHKKIISIIHPLFVLARKSILFFTDTNELYYSGANPFSQEDNYVMQPTKIIYSIKNQCHNELQKLLSEKKIQSYLTLGFFSRSNQQITLHDEFIKNQPEISKKAP